MRMFTSKLHPFLYDPLGRTPLLKSLTTNEASAISCNPKVLQYQVLQKTGCEDFPHFLKVLDGKREVFWMRLCFGWMVIIWPNSFCYLRKKTEAPKVEIDKFATVKTLVPRVQDSYSVAHPKKTLSIWFKPPWKFHSHLKIGRPQASTFH